MSLYLKRCISFLMALILLAGMVPAAYATETTEPTVSVTEETIPATEETVSSEATEIPENTTGPPVTEPEASTGPTIAEEVEPSEPEKALQFAVSSSNAVMAASSGTISGVKLFDQASPNYTTYLSSQLTVKYKPNGTGSAVTAYIKNLGWHFARINNVAYEDDPL